MLGLSDPVLELDFNSHTLSKTKDNNMATVRGSVPLGVIDRFLRGVIRTLPPHPANARYTRTLLIVEA